MPQGYKSLHINPYEVLGVSENVSLVDLDKVNMDYMRDMIRIRKINPYDKILLEEFKLKREAYEVIRSQKDLAFYPTE